MSMTATAGRHERAQQAWSALPHGGRNQVRLQVQCSRAHHVAAIYQTSAGLPLWMSGRADALSEPSPRSGCCSWSGKFGFLPRKVQHPTPSGLRPRQSRVGCDSTASKPGAIHR
jgi:hypothetical protein